MATRRHKALERVEALLGMMNHQAIRPKVCHGCPFTTASRSFDASTLSEARRQGIVDALHQGESFTCHIEIESAAPRMCTGAAALLELEDRPNLIMSAASFFGEPPFCFPDNLSASSLDGWLNQTRSNQ